MKDQALQLNVLKVKQPIGEFFIASIKPQDLVEISYSDVRRLAKDQRDLEKYLGIQRPISKKRIKEIKDYIKGSDATFPTGVVVAVDQKCAEFEEVNDNIGVLKLSPHIALEGEGDDVPYNRIAKVIDGQHRIASFMNEDDNWEFDFGQRDFDINLVIFVGADVSEQANIFATVNLAQTKVNRSLVYDLTELAKTPSPHKTCHNVAVILDAEPTSPLFQRIKRLGIATPGRKNEPLTQASFVEALVGYISKDPVSDRNILLDGGKLESASEFELKKTPFRELFRTGKEIDIAEILFNYFSAVRLKWPNSWDEVTKSGNLLPRSNAFKALMKYLQDDVYVELTEPNIGRVPEVSEFEEYFKDIEVTDEDFTTRNFAPGSGGQSRFLKMLRKEISIEDMIRDD